MSTTTTKAAAGERVAAALAARPEGTAAELAADTGLGQSTVGKALAALEADGAACRGRVAGTAPVDCRTAGAPPRLPTMRSGRRPWAPRRRIPPRPRTVRSTASCVPDSCGR